MGGIDGGYLKGALFKHLQWGFNILSILKGLLIGGTFCMEANTITIFIVFLGERPILNQHDSLKGWGET